MIELKKPSTETTISIVPNKLPETFGMGSQSLLKSIARCCFISKLLKEVFGSLLPIFQISILSCDTVLFWMICVLSSLVLKDNSLRDILLHAQFQTCTCYFDFINVAKGSLNGLKQFFWKCQTCIVHFYFMSKIVLQ